MEFGTTRHDFEAADRIDVLCDAFEDEYRAGRVPVIEDFVARSSEPDRSDLIVELVLLDVNYRERQGETPVFADYADRFPGEREALRQRLPLEPESADQSFESTVTGPAATRIHADAQSFGRLGRYELLEQLGTGGFGEVWKARDPVLNREVAVKTLRSDREFPTEVVNQFLEEGRKLARLEHPFIVPVYDVGYVEDRCYIVSKLIEGETLEEKIRRESRLPAADAAEIVARVADALHHAHLQGLVHRDIKPSNILLDRTGRPHLADFGLAISEEEQLDEGPSTVGTYAYMSPEQVRGASHLVDARSDIYSLGVVLYRLVTGRTPFLGRNRSEWEQQIQSRPPRPPRTIKDDIPAPLEDVCLKCLSKDIDGRYRTAADLAGALRQASAGETESAPLRGRWMRRLFMASGASLTFTALVFAVFKRGGDPDSGHLREDGVPAEAIHWPTSDGVSYWTVAPGGESLIVNCEQYGLIRVGELVRDEPSVDFSVVIGRISRTGSIGIFCGHRAADDGDDHVQFELIQIGKQYDGESILIRKLIDISRTDTWNRKGRTVDRIVINETERNEHTMTVRIRDGRIEEVEWDGVSQPELVDDPSYPESVHDEAFGGFGVFVNGTSGNFSNIRVNGTRLRFVDQR